MPSIGGMSTTTTKTTRYDLATQADRYRRAERMAESARPGSPAYRSALALMARLRMEARSTGNGTAFAVAVAR